MPPPFPLTPTSSDSDPFCTQKFCDYEDIVPTLTSIERQSIGTSSDWTYQSISATPLSSTSFPLIPTSAQGDPFCTDSFCQDNSGTEDDAAYYTSRYEYVRVRAVWSVNNLGTIETWPLRNNPGIPVFFGPWYNTKQENFAFALEDSTLSVLSPRRPQGSPVPRWLINFTQRGARDGGVWGGFGQGGNALLFINPLGIPRPAEGGMSAYNLPLMYPDTFFMSVEGVFQFTNGPLINVPGYPSVSSESEIVEWRGLPHPANYIYS